MSKPLNKTTLIKNSHAEEISNESDNLAFSQVLNSRLSRRSLLQAGGAIGVVDATTAAYPGYPERIALNCTGGTATLEAGALRVERPHQGHLVQAYAEVAAGGVI